MVGLWAQHRGSALGGRGITGRPERQEAKEGTCPFRCASYSFSMAPAGVGPSSGKQVNPVCSCSNIFRSSFIVPPPQDVSTKPQALTSRRAESQLHGGPPLNVMPPASAQHQRLFWDLTVSAVVLLLNALSSNSALFPLLILPFGV